MGIQFDAAITRPHQGIRLERIRSELDDEFENAENMMVSDGITPMTDVNQTPIVEQAEKRLNFYILWESGRILNTYKGYKTRPNR